MFWNAPELNRLIAYQLELSRLIADIGSSTEYSRRRWSMPCSAPGVFRPVRLLWDHPATPPACVPTMTDLPSRPNLLKELDARQDEVLEQLEELNARVETLIAQFTAGGDEGGFSAVDGGAGERGY